MADPQTTVMGLIFGRWRSQALYAGVKLGIFDGWPTGRKQRRPPPSNWISTRLSPTGC